MCTVLKESVNVDTSISKCVCMFVQKTPYSQMSIISRAIIQARERGRPEYHRHEDFIGWCAYTGLHFLLDIARYGDEFYPQDEGEAKDLEESVKNILAVRCQRFAHHPWKAWRISNSAVLRLIDDGDCVLRRLGRY